MAFRGRPTGGEGPTPNGDAAERWLRNGQRRADDAVARRLLSQVPERSEPDRRNSSDRLGGTLNPYESDPE